MRKISLVLVISVSFITGTLVTGNFVFADPEDSQNSLLDQILAEVFALVTIQYQGTTHYVGLEGAGIIRYDGCTSIDAMNFFWIGEPAGTMQASGITWRINQVEVTDTDFAIRGTYDVIGPGCALGSRELPHVYTLAGECGEGVTAALTSDGGMSGTFTGNVACVESDPGMGILSPG